MIEFTAPIQPVAKARPRVAVRGGKARAYTPRKTADYEEKLAGYCPVNVINGPVRVDINVTLAIPSSWSGGVREQAILGRVRPTSRPDVDNYAKAILDAIEGRAFVDDSQVVELFIRAFYNVDPIVHCRIEPIL